MPIKNKDFEYITLRVKKDEAKLIRRAAEAERRSVMNWAGKTIAEKLDAMQASGELK
jgi:uncharacterized protein (DUF1778 family)